LNFRKLIATFLATYAMLLINSDHIVAPADLQRVLVVHESSKVTPEFQVLVAGVQSLDSPVRKWADERKMNIQFLSTRAQESNGKPAELLERFKPYTPPELLLLSADGKRCIKRMPCPMSVESFSQAIGKK